MRKILDYFYDLDRPLELFDWVLILFLIFLLGMAVTEEVKAQTRIEIETVIIQSAKAHGINPNLALAMAEVESQMNPRAVGALGEVGLFQLRPEFHWAVSTNVKTNTVLAMRYLAQLKKSCRHYGDAFFVCFNYGPVRQLKHPKLFPYYRKVQIAMQRRINHESATKHIAQAD